MKTLKKWIVDLFYIPKYEKVSDKSFSRIILSSILGAFICVFCLAGLTWAWFTSSVSSNANTISAAKFDVEITVTQDGDETQLSPTVENGTYKYTLSAGKDYKVIIKALGDAEKRGGYCSVTYLRETPYHTVQLYPGSNVDKIHSVTFTVSASANSSLIITPQWGTYAKPDTELLIGNSTDDIDALPLQSLSLLGAETDETEKTEETEEAQTYQLTDTEQLYTVQAGDTLAGIAERYGTTTAVLSAYNGIQNTSYIQSGATLKIPPVGYTVPAGADPEQPADNPEPVESTSQQAAATPEPVESPSEQAAATPEPAESTSEQAAATPEPAESSAEAAESPEATTSSASTDPEPISE